MYKILSSIFIVLFTFILIFGEEIIIPPVCVGCICEAMSNCDTKLQCHGDICGAFNMTWGYWVDGGKLTIWNQSATEATAFSNCANDPSCAADVVEGYLEKYARDCDGNGIIDCDDFIRIHYLGPNGCTGSLTESVKNTFNTCKELVF